LKSVTRKRLLVVIHICEIIFLSDYIPLKTRNMLLQHAATHHYGKGCSSSLSRNCLPSPDCQTLKHAATCHMLYHVATHWNTLHHAATRCNTLKHAATRCNRHRAHCYILQYAATSCKKHGTALPHAATHNNKQALISSTT